MSGDKWSPYLWGMNNVAALTPQSVVGEWEQSSTETTGPVLTWSKLFREKRLNSSNTRAYTWVMLQYTQLIKTVNCLLEIKSEANLILKSLSLSLRLSPASSLVSWSDLKPTSMQDQHRVVTDRDSAAFPMTLKSHALQHRELCCFIFFLPWLCTEPHIRSIGVLIRWNGRFRFRGGGGGGPKVEITMTSGKARSDLRQISAEMSGVHPVVTLTSDSSAVLEFSLRSTTGYQHRLLN